MAKSEKTKVAATRNTQVKKRKISNSSGGSDKSRCKGGIDEFDVLFSEKKRQDKQIKEEEEREANRKAAKKARFKSANCSSQKKYKTDADSLLVLPRLR